MIGDLISNVIIFVKQLFCIHDYNIKTRWTINRGFNIYECKKCGRQKVNEI